MKVLVASDYYRPHWTGIVKALVNLLEVLKKRIQFTVITVRYVPELAPEENLEGTRIIRAAPLFRVSRASYSLQAVWKFAVEIRHHDAALINSPCTNILPYAVLTKLFGKRLVIFHQGDLTLRAGWKNRVVEGIFRICTAGAMHLADSVSTYTLDYAEHSPLLSRFLKKFKPMRMPMLPRPLPPVPPVSVKPMLDLKKDGAIIFGIAGRFVHEKGFDILFEAIPLVLKKIPQARFVFAGETNIAYENFFGELQSRFESVQPYVTFLGLLPEVELWSFYDLLDVIVISSRTDCFPLVQMEACLSGKPAVCTDIPGARYLVQRTGFGRLCKKENAADLAEKMIAVAADRGELMKFHGTVKEYLDVGAIAEENFRIITGQG